MKETGGRRQETKDYRTQNSKHKTPTEVLKQERENNNIFSLQKKFFIELPVSYFKKNIINRSLNFRQASV